MAANGWVGVNEVARKLKAGWVGVGGTARKIKAGWVGVNDVARKIFPDDSWWLAPSMAESDCICAYRFKGAGSESKALSDLTGHGYTLTKSGSVSFNNDTGFVLNGGYGVVRGLDNANVSGINSVILRYIGLNGGTQCLARHIIYDSDSGEYVCYLTGYYMNWVDFNGGQWARRTIYLGSNTFGYGNGVIGYNVGQHSVYAFGQRRDGASNRPYIEGVGQITTNWLVGNSIYAQRNNAEWTAVAIAYYNRHLTDSEMATIYNQINIL